MSLTLKCATDSRDCITCEALPKKNIYSIAAYENGELVKTVGINVETAKEFESQVFQYLHEAFEPNKEDCDYTVYQCAHDQSDAFESEQLEDVYDKEVLALDFQTYTLNLNSETAKLLLEDLRNFILEAE